MTATQPPPEPTVVPSRAERQRETREALVMAALAAFTRDGYQGASLEGIANDAGFSKGAVYSNFDGKAELFLAVMDHNLQALRGTDWDPFDPPEALDPEALDAYVSEGEEPAELVRGFGLASLEFLAIAARDDELMAELQARFQVLIDAYGRVAARDRRDDEVLPVDDVARLLVAFDQGFSLLLLSGVVSIEGDLMRTGLGRLLHPATDATHDLAPEGTRSAHPDVERVRRLLRDTTR